MHYKATIFAKFRHEKNTKELQSNKRFNKTFQDKGFWMTHTVTDHKPETVTLHCGENNCGTKWVVAE